MTQTFQFAFADPCHRGEYPATLKMFLQTMLVLCVSHFNPTATVDAQGVRNATAPGTVFASDRFLFKNMTDSQKKTSMRFKSFLREKGLEDAVFAFETIAARHLSPHAGMGGQEDAW